MFFFQGPRGMQNAVPARLYFSRNSPYYIDARPPRRAGFFEAYQKLILLIILIIIITIIIIIHSYYFKY